MSNALESIVASEARTGCDRVGCTEPISVGDTVRYSARTQRVFHEMHACNGFETAEVTEIGRAYIAAVRAGTALPEVPARTPRGKKSDPANLDVDKLTDDQRLRLIERLIGAEKLADLVGTATPKAGRK